jgi:hypothetical protein
MNNWPITHRDPKDEYGDPLPEVLDYVNTDVPEDYHTEAAALRYIEPWRMDADAILDMDYVTFVRRTLLHKAVTMRRPTKTKHDKIMRNTFGGRY